MIFDRTGCYVLDNWFGLIVRELLLNAAFASEFKIVRQLALRVIFGAGHDDFEFWKTGCHDLGMTYFGPGLLRPVLLSPGLRQKWEESMWSVFV